MAVPPSRKHRSTPRGLTRSWCRAKGGPLVTSGGIDDLRRGGGGAAGVALADIIIGLLVAGVFGHSAVQVIRDASRALALSR